MIITVTLNPCVDHTLFVDALRPHDTNRVSSVEIDAGGKGINAARVITGLGGSVIATGFLGGNNGVLVRNALDRESVAHDFTAIAGETRINFAVEDLTGLPPTCFNEPGPTVTLQEIDALLQHLQLHLSKAHWLLLAGSTPPGLTPEVLSRLGNLARENSVRFAVDADGENLRAACSAGPSLVKPNVNEASRLLGRPLVTVSDILAAANEIREMIIGHAPAVSPIVIISRGAEGAIMRDTAGFWMGKTPQVEVRSSVGSGDSMVAAVLTALDRGRPAHEALALGMAAGAAAAQREGSGLATFAQTKDLLSKCLVERVGVESV